MKTQIDQLVELAKAYVEFGKENLFPLKYTTLQENSLGKILIEVYLNDAYETAAVDFDKISISLYSKKITFPYDYTEEKLQEIYDEALKVFEITKTENLKELKDRIAAENKVRIEALKKELEILERC